MNTAVLCTPLRVEHAALRGAGRTMRLVRTGMGPRRAAHAAATFSPTNPVLVAGLAAAQSPHIHSGDLVVASEVRALVSNSATTEPAGSPSAALLAGALRRLGLTVHVGPICSVPRIASGPVADGVLAVDMESAQLAPANAPFAVVRAIVDTPEHPLWQIGTVQRGITALRTLRACRPALEWWAAATGPREVLLAAPRSFCAGVARAIDTVEGALRCYGAPVYVRRQIVHNAHVVHELQARGAVFVDEVGEVPAGSQRAVRAIARHVDLVLVVGSPNSSNSVRLVEVAHREGAPAYLVDDVSEIDLRWLASRRRVGITAGASAPPHLVDEIVHCLRGLGPLSVSESQLIDEDVTFALPKEVI